MPTPNSQRQEQKTTTTTEKRCELHLPFSASSKLRIVRRHARHKFTQAKVNRCATSLLQSFLRFRVVRLQTANWIGTEMRMNANEIRKQSTERELLNARREKDSIKCDFSEHFFFRSPVACALFVSMHFDSIQRRFFNLRMNFWYHAKCLDEFPPIYKEFFFFSCKCMRREFITEVLSSRLRFECEA